MANRPRRRTNAPTLLLRWIRATQNYAFFILGPATRARSAGFKHAYARAAGMPDVVVCFQK
jgi:hypothetical protein